MTQEIDVNLAMQDPSGGMVLPDGSMTDALIDLYDEENQQADALVDLAETTQAVRHHVAAIPGETITPVTAEVLRVAVESFHRGTSVAAPRVFAKEQFEGGLQAKRHSHKLALEALADTIKKVLDKIMKFIRKVMSYLFDLGQQLVFGADNISKAAQQIKNAARGIAHKQVKNGHDSINDERLISFFTARGDVYEPEALIRAYKEYGRDMTDDYSVGFMKEVALRTQEAMQQAIEGEDRDATVAKVDKLLSSLLSKSFRDFKASAKNDNHETLEKPLPFDDRRLVLVLTKEGGKMTGFHVGLERGRVESSLVKERVLKTLSYDQITALATEVENQMTSGLFKDYSRAKSELSRIRAIVEKGCDRIMDDLHSGSNRASVNYSVSFLKDLVTSLVDMFANIHRYDIAVARQVLAYCDRSIKSYG